MSEQRTMRITWKFLGIFPIRINVQKPHIRRMNSSAGLTWFCESNDVIGYGKTPKAAWNDWANYALI
jgi:hypothetical protein